MIYSTISILSIQDRNWWNST